MKSWFVLLFPTSIFTMRATLVSALPGLFLSQISIASPVYHTSEAYAPGCDAKLGAVASESSICSKIGVDTLLAGGNAADGLVATVLCIGVVGMYHR
jgi:gamma-glutamyltranspeptidase / glutathione hydrolase